MFFLSFVLAAFAFLLTAADNNYNYDKKPEPLGERDKTLISLNVSTGGPYTYSQSKHHFYGTAYDGSYIDTYGKRNLPTNLFLSQFCAIGCCSGQSGSCRDNPSCQCQVSVGPLPQVSHSVSK